MRKAVAALMLLGTATCANAEPVGSVGLMNMSDSGISLTGLYAEGGYRFRMNRSNFSVIPEVRIASGTSNDTYAGRDIKLKNFYGVNVRGQWDGRKAYFFIQPAYSHARVNASYGASASGWNFGGGFGAGYKFSPALSVEGSWENFDGTDIYSAGLRYHFNR